MSEVHMERAARCRLCHGFSIVVRLLIYCVLVTSMNIAVAQDEEEAKEERTEKSTEHMEGAEKIVVTAQRREELLQKVPLSVTTAKEEELARSAVNSTLTLPRLAPGLVVSTISVIGLPYIRGVGSEILGIGADPSLAVYLDGVYQPRPVSSIFDFYDTERVEVVKGPQGTLYGRNATAGTINIASRLPEPGFHAATDVVVGNYETINARGFVNVPVKNEKSFFRLSFLRAKHDGYMNDLYAGQQLAAQDLWAGRAQFRFLTSNNRLDVVIGARIMDQDDTRSAGYSLDPNQPSPAKDVFGGTVPENPRDVLFDYPTTEKLERSGGDVRLTWNLDEISLTSVTAYRKSDAVVNLDLDATEIDFVFNSDASDESRAISQDLQIASRSSQRGSWVAGAFFLREDAFQRQDINLPIAGIQNVPVAENRTDAWAVFGEGEYLLTRKLRGTAGVRYSYEKKHHVLTQSVNEMVFVADEEDSWDSITPRLGLEYHPSNTMMFYAFASRGFKSGGFNSAQIQDSFDPEDLWSYEVGLKSSFLGDRLLANFAGFYYDYDDIQIVLREPPAGTLQRIVNAAEAEVKGAEADVYWYPVQGLSLRTSLAFLDARFTDFVSIDGNNPDDDPDRSGNTLPRAPSLAGTMAVSYTWSLEARGYVTLYAGYNYQSEVFFDPYESDAARQGSYDVWDASLRYDSNSREWYVAAFVSNLGNELYARNILSNNSTQGTLRIWAPPRTGGLRVGFEF